MTKSKQGFTQHFGDSGRYVYEGDTITCTINGFDVTARIVRDEHSDKPDEMQDGFWPSLDPNDAGYIGPKSESTLRRHMARARQVMQAWEQDEWFYCGVVLTVSRRGVKLSNASLWGIECNFPTGRKRANAYLRDVANELLDEAIEDAETILDGLLESRDAA